MELMLAAAYDAPVLVRLALVCIAAVPIAWSSGPHRIQGDIDGDGRPDTVSLTQRAHSFVLRVDTGERVITRRVRGFSGPQAAGIGDPHVVALRPLNTRRGLEIEVEVWHGAANQFLIFYALDHGRLVPMTGGPHDPAYPPYVWDVGGTIGTGTSQADCVHGAKVGVLLWWRHRGVSHYRTTVYDVRGTRFVRSAVYELASERLVPSLPTDWPQVKRLAFESCGSVR